LREREENKKGMRFLSQFKQGGKRGGRNEFSRGKGEGVLPAEQRTNTLTIVLKARKRRALFLLKGEKGRGVHLEGGGRGRGILILRPKINFFNSSS